MSNIATDRDALHSPTQAGQVECNETSGGSATHTTSSCSFFVQLHLCFQAHPQTSNSTTSLRTRAPSKLPAWHELWVPRILTRALRPRRTAITPQFTPLTVLARIPSGARETAALQLFIKHRARAHTASVPMITSAVAIPPPPPPASRVDVTFWPTTTATRRSN